MLVMTTPLTAELKRLHKLCFCCDFDSFRHHKLPKTVLKEKDFTLLTSHHLIEHSSCSPPSIHATSISQNLFLLSWLTAPFLPFCVGKFSAEATVIVLQLGPFEALQASPGNTEGDGKTGRGTENQHRGWEPRIRGQSTMMLRSAVLGVKSISRFIISLHTFKLRCAHTGAIEVLFITCAFKLLTHLHSLNPNCLGKIALLSFLLWMPDGLVS